MEFCVSNSTLSAATASAVDTVQNFTSQCPNLARRAKPKNPHFSSKMARICQTQARILSGGNNRGPNRRLTHTAQVGLSVAYARNIWGNYALRCRRAWVRTPKPPNTQSVTVEGSGTDAFACINAAKSIGTLFVINCQPLPSVCQ